MGPVRDRNGSLAPSRGGERVAGEGGALADGLILVRALVAEWCLFVCAFRYCGLAAIFWRFTQSPGASVLLVIGALGTLFGLFDMLVTVPVVALAVAASLIPRRAGQPLTGRWRRRPGVRLVLVGRRC